jgi:alpha-ketoglutarate-dependent taurine dioxygenase
LDSEDMAMTITTKNLDAALGAEVSGIDLSKVIARDDVKAIEDVWSKRFVVVFHEQSL